MRKADSIAVWTFVRPRWWWLKFRGGYYKMHDHRVRRAASTAFYTILRKQPPEDANPLQRFLTKLVHEDYFVHSFTLDGVYEEHRIYSHDAAQAVTFEFLHGEELRSLENSSLW